MQNRNGGKLFVCILQNKYGFTQICCNDLSTMKIDVSKCSDNYFSTNNVNELLN